MLMERCQVLNPDAKSGIRKKVCVSFVLLVHDENPL